jgi:hypothetical protein
MAHLIQKTPRRIYENLKYASMQILSFLNKTR